LKVYFAFFKGRNLVDLRCMHIYVNKHVNLRFLR